MNKCTVGFIGYGNMAKAIARAFSDKNVTSAVYAYDLNLNAADDCVTLTATADETVKQSDFVFLSIKPQSAESALNALDFSNKTVISIMAGVPTQKLKRLCANCDKIVRVMPNLCARVGKAVNAYCCDGLSESERVEVSELLNSFGLAAEIDESFFDVVTGLTGSSPAYTFRYAKALTECGVKHGMSFEQSRDMTLYCIAACMDVLRSASSLDEMQTTINNVCSKGGTTIEGIYKLDEGNFDDLVISAVDAAIARSAELSKK